jgi:putative nucleotidyltransferase with HDIG domain
MHSMDVLSKTPPRIEARLMALFHDIGKVLTKTVTPEGAVHFYGHEVEGEKMVRKIMNRLKYPNKLIDAVANGVRNHMKLKHGGDDASGISDKTLRKFRDAVGENLADILDVIHADNISHSEMSSMPNQIEHVRKRLESLDANISSENLKLPINGNDIKIATGAKEGKTIGILKDAVQEAWYENPNLTRDEALKIVIDLAAEMKLNEVKKLMASKSLLL